MVSTWVVSATGVTPGPRHHQLPNWFSFKLGVWENCLIRGPGPSFCPGPEVRVQACLYTPKTFSYVQ